MGLRVLGSEIPTKQNVTGFFSALYAQTTVNWRTASNKMIQVSWRMISVTMLKTAYQI